MALSLLRQTRQTSGESIRTYAERILSLAEDAYNNLGGDAGERQLIDIFIDGLTNDQFQKWKFSGNSLMPFKQQKGLQKNEQTLRTRVQMSNQKPSNRHF